MEWDLGPNRHTVAAKQIFDPPHPTPPHPEKWCPSMRGRVVKIKTSLEDNFVSQNDDITRGGTSDIMLWGSYANDPKKRGSLAPAPALDLTTSLQDEINGWSCHWVLYGRWVYTKGGPSLRNGDFRSGEAVVLHSLWGVVRKHRPHLRVQWGPTASSV